MEKEIKKDNLILVLGILIVIGLCIFGISWYLITKKPTQEVLPPQVELEDDNTQKILKNLDEMNIGIEPFEQEFRILDEDLKSL